jgi:hypothetical protein
MRKPIRRLAVAAATGVLTAGAFATVGGMATAATPQHNTTHVATVSVRGCGGGGGWGWGHGFGHGRGFDRGWGWGWGDDWGWGGGYWGGDWGWY